MTQLKTFDHQFEALRPALLASDYFSQGKAHSVTLLSASNRRVSHTFLIRASFKSGCEQLYWVKVHDNAVGEYQFLRNAAERFKDIPSLDVAKPVVYLDNFRALVTEHAPGEVLWRRLRRRYNRIASLLHPYSTIDRHLYMCGQWLAVLHSSELPEDQKLHAETVPEYIRERLRLLVASEALDGESAQCIDEAIERTVMNLDAGDLVRVHTHGDYAPYNVLVADELLTVLDCDAGGYFHRVDNYCSRYTDVTLFYGFVTEMSRPLMARRLRHRLAEQFINGYNEHSTERVDPSSPVFNLFRLRHKIVTTVDARGSFTGRLIGRKARAARLLGWVKEAFRA